MNGICIAQCNVKLFFTNQKFISITFSCNENYDLLYMAHQFLIYSCQVYFGYKINNFLNLPLKDQTVERGFYLLSCWWCPTVDKPYRDISKKSTLIQYIYIIMTDVTCTLLHIYFYTFV